MKQDKVEIIGDDNLVLLIGILLAFFHLYYAMLDKCSC